VGATESHVKLQEEIGLTEDHWDSILAAHGFVLLADVADGVRCDSFSQPVIRRELATIAMPVFSRRWHKIGEPVQEVRRRERR
jgi:hypothetical protein